MPVKITKVAIYGPGTEVVSHLARTLHLTADDQVVEETDPAGVTVLGGKGLAVTKETIDKYGLTASQLEQEPEPEVEPPPETEPPPVEEIPPPEAMRRELPEDFPYRNLLEVAGVTTYEELKRRIAAKTLTDVAGIGDTRANEIIIVIKKS